MNFGFKIRIAFFNYFKRIYVEFCIGVNIIKKCNSNFETKILEALLIKKHNPKLNRKLFANGSSFLLNIF